MFSLLVMRKSPVTAAFAAASRVCPPQVIELSERLAEAVSPAFHGVSEVSGVVNTVMALMRPDGAPEPDGETESVPQAGADAAPRDPKEADRA